MHITKSQLINILSNTSADHIICRRESKIKVPKRSDLYRRFKASGIEVEVTNEHTKLYEIGGSYGDRVNDELEKQGLERDFHATSRNWGTDVRGAEGRVIYYAQKDEYYIVAYDPSDAVVKKYGKPASNSVIKVDGRTATYLEREEIETFKQPKPKSRKQLSAGVAPGATVDIKFIPFDSIEWIEIDGEKYEL